MGYAMSMVSEAMGSKQLCTCNYEAIIITISTWFSYIMQNKINNYKKHVETYVHTEIPMLWLL